MNAEMAHEAAKVAFARVDIELEQPAQPPGEGHRVTTQANTVCAAIPSRPRSS